MNEKLQEELALWLEKTREGLEGATAQIPEILQQYITFKYYSAIAWAIISALISAICIYSFYKIYHGEDRFEFNKYGWKSWKEIYAGVFLLTSGTIIISLPAFAHNLQRIFYISIAPKAWLIQDLVQMARGCR